MSVNEVNFNVQMSCGGCSNAVKKILTKIEGVESVEPDLEQQKVKVMWNGDDPQILLTALKKWGTAAGKTVELIVKS